MPRYGYSHYKNYGEPGEFIFFTTTCLDFVHAFSEPAAANRMAASLLHDCRRYGARLHAFVVVPHHFYGVVQLPSTMGGSNFLRLIKSNSARRVLKSLSPRKKAEFAQQIGLNNRTFWKRGFKSTVIRTAEVLYQKMRYTHANPVKAGLVSGEADYCWSSARFRIEGRLDEDWAVAIDDAMIEEFCSLSELQPSMGDSD